MWKGTEKGCVTPDGEKANKGEAVVVVPEGQGFVETYFDFEHQIKYNETTPNPLTGD